MTIKEYEEYEEELDKISQSVPFFPNMEQYEKYLAKTPGMYADYIVWLLLKSENMNLDDEQRQVRKKLIKTVYQLFPLED